MAREIKIDDRTTAVVSQTESGSVRLVVRGVGPLKSFVLPLSAAGELEDALREIRNGDQQTLEMRGGKQR